MTKYEYKTIGHTLFDWGGIIGILNREGDEGWQVVHRGPDTFLLMREKEPVDLHAYCGCEMCTE